MKLTYLKRRGGKTTRAVAECKRTGAILVVASPSAKRFTETVDLPESQIATFREAMSGRCFEGRKFPTADGRPELIIDNADSVLRQLFNYKIRRVTMSKPFTKADCKKYGLPPDMVGRT